VFPGHVSNFDDATVAFERWLAQLGGEPIGDVAFELLVDGGGEPVGLSIRELAIRFPAVGTVLEVAVNVDTSLMPTYYKFDFRHQGGKLIWRYDMHKGHEREHGGLFHVHYGNEQNRRPSRQMDLGDITDRVVAFNAGQ
jgi:hypothetical protein